MKNRFYFKFKTTAIKMNQNLCKDREKMFMKLKVMLKPNFNDIEKNFFA